MDKMALDGQYPTSWNEYVGQDTAKYNLRVTVKSARKRQAQLPHILITSPYAGIGKTALALLTAGAMGNPVHVVSGCMNINDARMMFAQVDDGYTIFYDEFHKIMDGGKRGPEWLLNYLENGVLATPMGIEEVPQVTFIGATTDKGLILPTILDRFQVVDLDPYTDEEAAHIAQNLARKVLVPADLPEISDETAAAVARAGSNQPRRIRELLMKVRDLAVVEEIPTPDDGVYELDKALTFANLTEDGLTKDAVRYMTFMYSDLHGQPAGESLLRSRLGLVGQGLQMVELLLLSKDFVATTKQGRMLTQSGIRRAKQLTAAA